MCGKTRWKAAKAVSKTMGHLDECGLEVAGCRTKSIKYITWGDVSDICMAQNTLYIV